MMHIVLCFWLFIFLFVFSFFSLSFSSKGQMSFSEILNAGIAPLLSIHHCNHHFVFFFFSSSFSIFLHSVSFTLFSIWTLFCTNQFIRLFLHMCFMFFPSFLFPLMYFSFNFHLSPEDGFIAQRLFFHSS